MMATNGWTTTTATTKSKSSEMPIRSMMNKKNGIGGFHVRIVVTTLMMSMILVMTQPSSVSSFALRPSTATTMIQMGPSRTTSSAITMSLSSSGVNPYRQRHPQNIRFHRRQPGRNPNNNNNSDNQRILLDNGITKSPITTTAPSTTTDLGMTTTTSSSGDETDDTTSKKNWIERVVPPKSELKKIVPLAGMFFCILFSYTILRDTKDVLMITAPKSGAEVIPFIKTYCNLPIAIGFTGLYSKMTDTMELKDIFYRCVITFLIFFTAFSTVIYPNRAFLHPHGLVDTLAAALPKNFAAPLSIIRNWSFAVFYVMAEMWGSVVASLLFWGFANEVTTVEEAKKYYPLFGLGANVALIFSGQYVKFVSNMRASLAPGVDAWAVSLQYLMGAVFGSGIVLLGTYKWMQDNIVSKKTDKDQIVKAPKMKKPKMTMKESAKFLLSSPYIRDMALLVISYGMCINIVEVSWKAKLKQAFPDPNSYSAFMGNFSSATGVVTLVMMLLGRTIFQKFGWGFAALVTPAMIGITGLGFFATNLFAPAMLPVAALFGMTPVMLSVILGAAQNILSKSSKYSLFDPCKEMAYIPLDKDSKTKGKAAIDVIGNPLGKSGGALIQQILIFGVGSLAAATPYLAVILGGLVYMWFKAANRLSVQFEDAMKPETAT